MTFFDFFLGGGGSTPPPLTKICPLKSRLLLVLLQDVAKRGPRYGVVIGLVEPPDVLDPAVVQPGSSVG